MQPLLKIWGANLKLKNPRFIANISPGIFRAVGSTTLLLKNLDKLNTSPLIRDENVERKIVLKNVQIYTLGFV